MNSVTYYRLKTVEAEDYKHGEMTEKQRARQLLTMQRLGMIGDDVHIDDPDVEVITITEAGDAIPTDNRKEQE